MISLLMATSVEAFRFHVPGEACIAMPTITRQPEPCTVEAGETARFEVTAEGDGLSFQWKRGALDIPEATGTSYELVAQPSDDGSEFSVVVKSADGSSKTSLPASLTVRREAPLLFDPRFARVAAVALAGVFLLVLWPLWVIASRVIGGGEALPAFPAAIAVQLVITGVALALAGFYLALLELRGRARSLAELTEAVRSEAPGGERGFTDEAIKAVPETLKAFGQLQAAAALLALAALLFVCATVLAWRGLPASPSTTTTTTTAPAAAPASQ
jgi:hypothetical protein